MNTDGLIRDVDGDLFVGPSRVLLRNVVTARARGESPEQIRDNFPSLSLAQVYGALVYYLEHQDALDAAFAEEARTLDALRAANAAAHASFYDPMHTRFEEARARSDEPAGEGA